MDLEVRAFGSLEIWVDGVGNRIGSRLRQVLLGILLVHQGSVVSTSTLADRMWPGERPACLAKGLQIHVHRIRGALHSTGAVRHRPAGYALAVPRAGVDLYRFEDLVRLGRSARSGGDEAGAAELLRQASALYRGPAFHGLDDVTELAVESDRLAELRLTGVEERIAADLALGEHAALVAELNALVAEHPLRERFRAQLMTALYRAGRKADALAAYRAGRKILVDQLGVEPGQECRALERAILADDPVLRPPAQARRRLRPTGRPPVPAQLPPEAAAFVGRADHLGQLDRLLPDPRAAAPGAVVVVAVLDGSSCRSAPSSRSTAPGGWSCPARTSSPSTSASPGTTRRSPAARSPRARSWPTTRSAGTSGSEAPAARPGRRAGGARVRAAGSPACRLRPVAQHRRGGV